MAIHHDKLAYGKLKGDREDISEDKIQELLYELNRNEPEGDLSENNKASVDDELKK